MATNQKVGSSNLSGRTISTFRKIVKRRKYEHFLALQKRMPEEGQLLVFGRFAIDSQRILARVFAFARVSVELLLQVCLRVRDFL